MEFLKTIDWVQTLKIIIGCLSIGIGIYLGRFAKSFILWIKSGIENGDGKLQNKELQIAIFTGFFGFMILSTTFFGKEYSMEMILGALAGAGIMYGANALSKKHPDIKDK
jgi:uncharacterized membrane protein